MYSCKKNGQIFIQKNWNEEKKHQTHKQEVIIATQENPKS